MHTIARTPTAWFFPFMTTVVIIQGIHVVEHIIQLLQVFVFGVADGDAFGLLGYVFQFQGTEEWLHLVFNATYLLSLYVLVPPLRRLVPRPLPPWAFWAFIYGVVLETWHMVEHGVIIANVIRNSGCPCPGIGDAALHVTDTVLHFGYNAVTYGAILVAYWFVARGRPHPPTASPRGLTRVGRGGEVAQSPAVTAAPP
jgi:hypothetical protein